MDVVAQKDRIIEETISKEYEKYSDDEKKNLHNLYHNYNKNPEKFNELIKKLEKVIFKKRPPTMAEFLTAEAGWLPRKVIDSIWPHVKEDLLNIVDGNEKYFQISMYGSTRLGKSFMAQLLMIYTIIFMHHLRTPALYYGLSPLTKLCLYIVSFKFDKSREIYLKDIYNFLENSDRFVKIKFQDQVKEKQEEYGCDKIVWSKASVSGEITVASGLQILLGNKNPDEIIGANCFQIYISEIAFFINQAGTSEDDIFELYTNSYSRIRATVGKNYLTWVFLDSSANFEESKIERHIIRNLQHDKDTYFRWRSQWVARPWDFKQYYQGVQQLKKEGITENINAELLKRNCVFQVITGNGSIPAQMVTHQAQLNGIPKDLIDYVPIDVKPEYENNLIKSIKDISGKPTSNESKLIQNTKLVDMVFSNEYLKNIEGGLVADAGDFPEGLLWNQIEQIFFYKLFSGRNQIYRAPNEPRFVGIDVAHSAKGDIYGFAMGHLEYSKTLRERMFIYDMIFAILPGSEGINLSAVEHFIFDLMNKGNVSVFDLASDTFQSAQVLQDLKRIGINITRPHLDTSLEPYIRLLTSLVNSTVKAGKNVFLSNNLKCLERARKDNGMEKIDHPNGPTVNKYFGDWKNSEAGKNAKDVADAGCSCHYSAMESSIIPVTIYEDENKRCGVQIKDADYDNQIENAFDLLAGHM